MKPMSMLACGIVVSLIAGTALGQPPPDSFSLHADTRTDLQAWKSEPVRTREVAQPVPLGDLRGDIANNARAQPAPTRRNAPRHH
jgi:hypothetical protein